MYIEYKGIQHPVTEQATVEQTARAVAQLHPEDLSNYQIVLKEGDPQGHVLIPKFGKKG